jgi:hypothetical protein
MDNWPTIRLGSNNLYRKTRPIVAYNAKVGALTVNDHHVDLFRLLRPTLQSSCKYNVQRRFNLG